jgi:hypothetical protein
MCVGVGHVIEIPSIAVQITSRIAPPDSALNSYLACRTIESVVNQLPHSSQYACQRHTCLESVLAAVVPIVVRTAS